MEGFSKDIGLPDAAGVPLVLLEQILDHVLALLLAAYNGGDLGLDVGADHVDRRGAGLQPDAVPAPLLHDFRLLQHQGVDGGHHNTVARLLHLLEGVGHLVVGLFHPGQLGEQGHQVAVVPDGEAGLLGQGVVKQGPGQLQQSGGDAGAQVDVGDAGVADHLAVPEGGHRAVHVPHPAQLGGALPDGGVQGGFDGVLLGEGVHPGGQEQVQLLHRELVEDAL